ncbi:hypothetical protein [Mycolicibacterium goodii]|uniref:Lipoprotein n=1 Tax=Mycolicibacterium goodii TaxID=134601 RepID=A0A0K0WZX0_MYCGD|nr:hypothetical protein AFA91_01360 [Mycolicibacterium goodii]
MSNRRTGAVLFALLVLATSACGDGEQDSADASTTTAFPYPPFEIRTDIAVPLEPPLLDAAKFALDMSVDNRLKNAPGANDIERRFRSRIAPEIDITDLPPPPATVVGETGGALHRAVGARALPDGAVEVDICAFATPGLYTQFKDGRVVGPDPAKPFSLERPVVRWTDEPAADGERPASPRWLLVHTGLLGNEDDATSICEPYKPEPFIQKMPDRTSTTAAPPSS